jgi:hypothetical protein
MLDYKCDLCAKIYSSRCNYLRHLNTNKHKLNAKLPFYPNESQMNPNESPMNPK